MMWMRNAPEVIQRASKMKQIIEHQGLHPEDSSEYLPETPTSLILIVDDLPINLKVLRRLLADTGHRLTFAVDGKQALERVQSARPDLILLDLMMPEMDGLEVCRRLKEVPKTANIPIIFLTANYEIEPLVKAFEQGAVDYITKPFRASELLTRLQTHLNLTHLQCQNRQRVNVERLLRQVVEEILSDRALEVSLSNVATWIQAMISAGQVLIGRCFSSTACKAITATDYKLSISSLPMECQSSSQSTQVSLAHPETLTLVDRQRLELCCAYTELRFPIQLRNGEIWGFLLVHFSHDCLPLVQDQVILSRILERLTAVIQQKELYQQLQTAHLQLKITHEQLVNATDQLELMNAELSRFANLDGLTQLANRRYFDSCLKQEWLRLRREQQPLSLLLIDVDYFKRYNDTYGHVQGDTCLAAIAQALKQPLKRPADLVARYGGEEFVVVLPNTSESGACQVAEQVRQQITRLKLPHCTHPSHDYVSVSVGIATLTPTVEKTWLDLLAYADKALYQAKANGRNCCAVVDTSI